MNYPEFKYHVQEEVQRALGSEARVIVQDIPKNNDVHLDGLTILSSKCNVSPTLYLDYYYKQYQKGKPLGETISDILSDCRANMPGGSIDISFFTDYEKAKDRLAFKLVNYARNEALLRDVPHFRFLDLAIVFQCILTSGKSGSATIQIYNQHLEQWNARPEDLCQIALSNTPRLLKYDLSSMTSVLRELLGASDPFPDDDLQLSFPLYMLSNRSRVNGSGCLLYPGLLQEIAGRLGDDFFILPSSVHEVLILPATGSATPQELTNMVREVNASQLAEEDILSDHVYFYSRQAQRLSM